jgi:hypothetical protein
VKWFFQTKSLRLKLVLISLLVEVVMLSLLVANSILLIESALDEQASARMKLLSPILGASLAAPLAQGNQALVKQILASTLTKEGLDYALL